MNQGKDYPGYEEISDEQFLNSSNLEYPEENLS